MNYWALKLSSDTSFVLTTLWSFILDFFFLNLLPSEAPYSVVCCYHWGGDLLWYVGKFSRRNTVPLTSINFSDSIVNHQQLLQLRCTGQQICKTWSFWRYNANSSLDKIRILSFQSSVAGFLFQQLQIVWWFTLYLWQHFQCVNLLNNVF